MNNQRNQRIYNFYAPVYDAIFGIFFRQGRRKAIAMLELQNGESLFIPGIGTGLDLLCLPDFITVTGVDLNAAMLQQATAKTHGCNITLAQADALHLPLADRVYDTVLFNLVLSVVPDGMAAFQESWRVLRPGGRAVIFDKFLPEGTKSNLLRQIIGPVIRLFGTDPNRYLNDIIGHDPDVVIKQDSPSILDGQYRIIVLEKRR